MVSVVLFPVCTRSLDLICQGHMSLWRSRESYAMVSLPFFMVMAVGGGANGAYK